MNTPPLPPSSITIPARSLDNPVICENGGEYPVRLNSIQHLRKLLGRVRYTSACGYFYKGPRDLERRIKEQATFRIMKENKIIYKDTDGRLRPTALGFQLLSEYAHITF